MTEEVVAPVESEVPQTEPTEQATEAPPTSETPEQEPDTPAQKPKEFELPRGVQRRIDRLTKARYEAEAQNKMLAERLQALERSSKPQQPPGAPKIEDFQDFDAYVAAKAEWVADQKINKALSERDSRSQAERDQIESGKVVESWNQKLQKASKDIPDLTEAIESSDVPMTQVMGRAIMESDVGPQLAYYLATHPDEAEDIAALGPLATVRALGRIEERLSVKKPAKPSGAPAPITPSGQKAQASKDPANMDYDDFVKFRRAQIAKRR